MGGLMYVIDWTQVFIYVLGSFGALLLFVYRQRIPAWRSWWQALITGVSAFPQLAKDVQGIKFFVSPNGGGSLMDSVQRTERAVRAMSEQMELLITTYQAEHDIDYDVCRFYCDATGANTYVSQTYARLLQVDRAELMGWGWLNFVHPDDLDDVRKHWEECRQQPRTYRRSHRLLTIDRELIHVEVVAIPVPRSAAVQRWVGSVQRVPNVQ